MLILYYHLLMILFIYYVLALTETPLCAVPPIRPLRHLNVLSEALKEETNQFVMRLLLIDRVQLYTPEVLSHTAH